MALLNCVADSFEVTGSYVHKNHKQEDDGLAIVRLATLDVLDELIQMRWDFSSGGLWA